MIRLAVAALALLPRPADDDPVTFVRAFLKARFTKGAPLEAFFGERLTLLPGHEYLKKEYGLSDTGDRRRALAVESRRFRDVAADSLKRVPADRLKRLREGLPGYGYEVRKLKDGVNPLDPAGTVRATASAGDIAVIVRPEPEGDFIACVLRKSGTGWRIVAEYLD